jgi:hypothetical protein
MTAETSFLILKVISVLADGDRAQKRCIPQNPLLKNVQHLVQRHFPKTVDDSKRFKVSLMEPFLKELLEGLSSRGGAQKSEDEVIAELYRTILRCNGMNFLAVLRRV